MLTTSLPNYEARVRQLALEEGVDPELAVAVWQQESSKGTDPTMRGPTLPEGHKYAGAYGQGPWQIMSFHGAMPADFDSQTRWALRYLKKNGPRGYYGETGGGGAAAPTGMPGFPSTNDYVAQVQDKMKLARAGTPDVQPGLFSMSEQPVPLQPPPQAQEKTMDETLMGEGTLQRLMADPMFLMGASVLANQGNVVKGLLGGTAMYHKMANDTAENRLRAQQIKALQNPRSGNISEYEFLLAQGVPKDQALRYSFAGSAGYGSKLANIGGVNYEQVQNPDGTTGWKPFSPQDQQLHEQRLANQKRAEVEGGKYGEQTAALRQQINDAAMNIPTMVKQTDELLAEIESGKYKDTGPIMGRVKELWDPDLAKLNFQAMDQALKNLQITNLAPVTVKELEMIQQMYAGAYKTPEQNAAVLRYLNDRMKERARRTRILDAKLRSGAKIEDLPVWVEETFTPFDDTVPQPKAPVAAAPQIPTTAQRKPEGMAEDAWQELLRLRGATGGF